MGKPQPHWLVADWLGLIEPTRGESCPSGQRRGPAAPGKDTVPSSDKKNFHISVTLTTRGRKRRAPGSKPPRTMRKPQPYWLVADWLGFMEPARDESCPSGQRRGSAAPGEDKCLSPDQKSSYISTTPANRTGKRRSPGSVPFRTAWKPQPHWLVADWLGLMQPARGESCPSEQCRGPVAPEEDRVSFPE